MPAMRIEPSHFGQTSEGTPVKLFTLEDGHGLKVKVISYGAILTELHAPDRRGQTADVVLGFAELAPYLGQHPYFGAVVGRVANRIAGAAFTHRGKAYSLTANNGRHSLHGGPTGMARRLWTAQDRSSRGAPAVEFSYKSPDKEEGFPGNLHVQATYSLPQKGTLRLEMTARSDQNTPVNLTNHSYFNLRGAGQGNILDHELFLAADFYTPGDAELIPTGEIRRVAGTPFDFTESKPVGRDIEQVPGGYDCNFVLRGGPDELRLAARLRDRRSGRVMEVWTTQPGIQLYTGNFLNGSLRGIGGVYTQYAGLCLETQHFPDALHHSHFPSILLTPPHEYRHVVEYRFSAD